MAKGKKAKQAKAQAKTVSFKVAQNCIEYTQDGKRRLNLSLKEISTVPKCIQKMTELDHLDLSRNFIKKVPEFIECFISICILDLHSNYIPVTIGRLQNLLVLNLCNNRLSVLPDEIGLLKNLQTLNLGLNRLEALPSSVGALKELRLLGLSDNLLTRVPGCLARLHKLEKVNLDRNPIPEPESAQEPAQVMEKLYLVKESHLCEDCLDKCQTERRRLEDVGRSKQPKIIDFHNFFGLIQDFFFLLN
uniref:Disease resistance R13L4/SHOC-2-like LRR domain-containing protein n=1 Tax=Sphaeramia orbicularis TaxID=375764 RepID=A0A672YWK6_9TELE